MKAENYIQIQGWMITNLNLTGNLLLTYALIYGFSQDGNSEFTGSINYVCKWLNCSRPTAIKVLKELTEMGLVDKTQVEVNNVTFNKYSANLTSAGSFEGGSKESLPLVKNLNGGSKESLPNNTIYNTRDIYIPPENKPFTEREFIEIWSRARLHYDKKPTNITRLTVNESSNLKDLLKDYKKEDVERAIAGLFFQDTFPAVRTRPAHLLERQHFETYLDCWNNKTKIFTKEKKKKDNTGMI